MLQILTSLLAHQVLTRLTLPQLAKQANVTQNALRNVLIEIGDMETTNKVFTFCNNYLINSRDLREEYPYIILECLGCELPDLC